MKKDSSKTVRPSNGVALSPGQREGYLQLKSYLPLSPITGLISHDGCGRTTILKMLAHELSAKMLRLADLVEKMEGFHPLQLEEAFAGVLLDAIKANDVVIIDDFHEVQLVFDHCYQPARPKVFGLALDGVVHFMEQHDKRLILGLRDYVTQPFHKQCLLANVPLFTPEDFSFLFQVMGGGKFSHIDFEQIHRSTPRLTARQMVKACQFANPAALQDTERFLDFLVAFALASNVDRDEVEEVSLESLHGVEEVIRQLEIDVITPFERQDLVKKLGIRPKRGVLLYGPPGTGKTTIGRALAHRLRSKFFLLDGTIISGTGHFYQAIIHLFQKAKENAPSIIFIDDCDVLFENDNETGLYRYLLTMLDGLESKGNSQVTVIFTAMNIGSLPPALIRSGRVELWLEMKLPDMAARQAILRTYLADGVLALSDQEFDKIAVQSEGFTGADLRRLAADARNLLGYDMAQEQPPQPALEYCMKAIRQLQKFREELERAPAFTAAHHGKRARLALEEVG